MRLDRGACAALLATLVALPSAILAQETAAACAAVTDNALPAALQGWNSRSDLAAAATPAAAASAALPIGKGVNGKLRKTGDVTFPVPLARPADAASYSGLYELRIAQAGEYQVSLGSSARIEVVAGTAVLEATAHASGVACTTLRKLLVYPLKPGRYVLEIAGNGDPVVPLLVTRVVK